MLLAMSVLTACGPDPANVTTDPAFKDVSKYPPEPKEATKAAIKADPAVADWFIYQAEACNQYGCV